jgi:hypothetical protein
MGCEASFIAVAGSQVLGDEPARCINELPEVYKESPAYLVASMVTPALREFCVTETPDSIQHFIEQDRGVF